MDSINNLTRQLSEDIKSYYLKAFYRCEDDWNMVCQKEMHNFILSREGWRKDKKLDNIFVYLEKYPITVSILYSNSPAQLMVDTATGIAKAELIEKIDNEDNIESLVDEIVISVKKQDWIIPFNKTIIK